ncbi:MAG: response regulator transcription factor [Solirubrobacteraceae bacterium]
MLEFGVTRPVRAKDDLRIVVAHRHRLVAEALERLLADLGLAVLGTACNRKSLLAALPDLVVDALMLDAELDPSGGTLALLEDVRAASPETSIVVLADEFNDGLALAAEEGDLDGLVLTSNAGVDLATTITQVAARHAVFPAGWLTRAHSAAATNPLAHLTPRQREVLHLLAQGLDNDLIAERLYISRNTVKAHVRTIYETLGVHNRVEAARTLAGVRAPGAAAR